MSASRHRTQVCGSESPKSPDIFVCSGVTLLERLEDGCSCVTSARSSDLPKVIHDHTFKIGPTCAELPAVEDWFALRELSKDIRDFRISAGKRI